MPGVGGEEEHGDRHACWGRATPAGGRGCTCWGLHLLGGAAHALGGPHLLEGRGAAPAGLQPPTRLHSPFPPSLTPHRPPGPLLPSLVAQGWTWVPVDLWGPETRTQAPRAGLLGALGEHMGEQGLLMASLTQEPRWPPRRRTGFMGRVATESGADHGGQCPRCACISGTVRARSGR